MAAGPQAPLNEIETPLAGPETPRTMPQSPL